MVEERLPSGKLLTFEDLIKFCYNLSETDLSILFTLMDRSPMDAEELSDKLRLSKAVLSRSLSKLYSLGFVKRLRKTGDEKIGRPRYVYVASSEELKVKMKKDLDKCSELIKKIMEKPFDFL